MVGRHRLPEPHWAVLAALPSAIQEVADGDTPPSGIPLLVAVNDRQGLGELTALVQTGFPVIALYSGTTPSIAVRCAQAGAGRVICLNEVEPGDLAGRLAGAADDKNGPWSTLDVLPFGVAICDEEGYRYRNPVHRTIDFHHLDGADGTQIATLDLTQVNDRHSGHVYLWSRVPLPGSDSGQMLELLEDITGRHTDRDEIARQRDVLRHRARDLARVNRALSELDRAKADFIALAAHEIRTPLTALNNAVHMLNRIKPERERERRMIDMAGRNVARLSALADDLLEFTKLETSHLSLHPDEADMNVCLWRAVDDVRAEADALQVSIHCELGTRLPTLHGEPDRIGQAIKRLIEYGVRRSCQGGQVRLRAACIRHWQPVDGGAPDNPPDLPFQPDQWVELSVTDQGGRLDPERADHLFTGFGSAGDQLADPVIGGGLGLAICRQVVHAHGGAVWAEAAMPSGTRLVMRLPCLDAAGLGTYQLGRRFDRLHQQQQVAWLVSLRSTAGPADAGVLVDIMQEADMPSSDWVFLDRQDEVITLVSGGKARLIGQLRRLLEQLPSSPGGNYPIHIGWARPDHGEHFDDILRRARAAARPLSECTEVTTHTGDDT